MKALVTVRTMLWLKVGVIDRCYQVFFKGITSRVSHRRNWDLAAYCFTQLCWPFPPLPFLRCSAANIRLVFRSKQKRGLNLQSRNSCQFQLSTRKTSPRVSGKIFRTGSDKYFAFICYESFTNASPVGNRRNDRPWNNLKSIKPLVVHHVRDCCQFINSMDTNSKLSSLLGCFERLHSGAKPTEKSMT